MSQYDQYVQKLTSIDVARGSYSATEQSMKFRVTDEQLSELAKTRGKEE